MTAAPSPERVMREDALLWAIKFHAGTPATSDDVLTSAKAFKSYVYGDTDTDAVDVTDHHARLTAACVAVRDWIDDEKVSLIGATPAMLAQIAVDTYRGAR